MPIPLIIGAVAAAAGIYGAAKGVSGAMDHSNAKDINNDARSLVDSANLKVEEQRKATNAVLEDYGQRKLRAFNGVVAEFIETFERLKISNSVRVQSSINLTPAIFPTKPLLV